MIILGIDTSCDDTSIAVVKAGPGPLSFDILSNIVSSQTKLHAGYGGVYPSLAKREHQRNLLPVLKKALGRARLLKEKKSGGTGKSRDSSGRSQADSPKLKRLKRYLEREPLLLEGLLKFLKEYKKPAVGAVAVTVGPGLEPCLWVGVNFAKALSLYWNLPLIAVNHIEGHIFANFLSRPGPDFQDILPAVCLVVSGGHSQLILMPELAKYKIIGETRDDAAGECLDKTARILGLPYPGGPAIEAAAEEAKAEEKNYKLEIKLPRPMIYQKNYDFSFSGLKTSVLYMARREKKKMEKKDFIRAMAKEIEQAIIDVLIKKTIKAASEYQARSIILGGGVAANKELGRQFRSSIRSEGLALRFFLPPKRLSTDNAAMIAAAGYFHYLRGDYRKDGREKADANLKIGPYIQPAFQI